ncbi:MAG: PEGA domain-containing protein, partial [Verrucomicrobiota bacterium]
MNRAQQWSRGLRPLLWWGLFVLVLYGYRQHQLASERTRLNFSVSLQQKPIGYESSAALDGTPFASGDKVSIGWHQLLVSHPKAEPCSTNFFTWYGAHDFGQINLKRSTGTLEVQISPPAPWLQIQGPEFSQILTNTSGLTVSVPTDVYSIDVRYAHWQQHDQVSVRNGVSTPWRIAPQLGTVTATCAQTGASFELLTPDNRPVETGEFPATITELPAGNYKIISQHHRNRRGDMVVVKSGITNDVRVEFVYGKVVLETEPAGATVLMDGGQILGDTPLNLPELPTGTWKLTLQRNGYEPAAVSLEVLANQTTTFRTNLVSRNYTAAMTTAERFLAAKDYNRALQAIGDALLAKPNDPVAFKLQRDAAGYVSLRRAETLGKQGDYIAGVKELEATLNALPNNSEALQLLADFKQRVPEQMERMRVERLNRGKKLFETVLSQQGDANLFETHEFKTS